MSSLTELGKRILFDRYAQKDPDRSNIAIGDKVMALINGGREPATVELLPLVSDNVLVHIESTGESQSLPRMMLDRLMETTEEEVQQRVARGIASVESDQNKQRYYEKQFAWLMKDWKFVPAGRILTSAGTDQALTSYNCYVIPNIPDSRKGIFESLSTMAEIMSRGGGVGMNISSLRPKNAYVKGVNGRSSGAVSWANLFSVTTGLIEQAGSRRGAAMIMMNDWHPEIFDFINAKRNSTNILNANISVAISDPFMEAVKADGDWSLRFPDTSHPDYDVIWKGDIHDWESSGHPVIVYQTVKARKIWDAIIESAWASAEPGVFFIDRYNKMSNSNYYREGKVICTNPCVTGDTLVSTSTGYVSARNLEVGMLIRTPKGLKPIEKLYNNGVQPIYRVNFSDGGFLEGTLDHKVKVVRNSRYEWVAFSDLTVGDKVVVLANEGSFGAVRPLSEKTLLSNSRREGVFAGSVYDRRLGLLAGTVIGDGTLRQVKSRNSYAYQCKIAFGVHETEWRSLLEKHLSDMNIHTGITIQKKDVVQSDGTVVLHQSLSMHCYKLATLLVNMGMSVNVKAPQKTIPSDWMSLDREFLAGLLDGLFSTDGTVNLKQSVPSVRLSTTSYDLAQQVRMILLQFGIHGKIYRAERKTDRQYDGRSMYGTGEIYTVHIMNEGIKKFYEEIGFTHPQKQERLQKLVEDYHCIGGNWTTSVVSVENTDREEEVFDLYEPETLTFVTNGYVSFDCAEQGLPAWGVCNLGALNLPKFFDETHGDVDWDLLRDSVSLAVRFLDNVIDWTPYFFDENELQQKSERRIGLGIMGLAELLIKMELRYGSDEAIAFGEKLMKFIAHTAYDESSCLAREKGAFPWFEADGFLSSGFVKTLDSMTRDAIRRNGIRNVTILTAAPTGTTGTMVNTSTGIEPYYALQWDRNSRLGVHTEYAAPYQEWLENHKGEKLPDYFVTAMELTPMEHARAQAGFQKWNDTSISKTVNAPNNYTIEQTSELYMALYDLGCKGGTIYRDGSRFEQVLSLKDAPSEEAVAQAHELEQLTCPECGEDVDDSTCDVPCKHCNFMGCAAE